MRRHHALPAGAEMAGKAVRFRIWAPVVAHVELALDDGVPLPMTAEAGGWFSLTTGAARPGSHYRYKIGDTLYPDPVSRFQPEGPHGPSEVVDPGAYRWRDGVWPGRPWAETVLYELHTGTFSATGDFAGIARHLDHLIALGVNAIEIMPVAETPGRWNWGYDGVLLYAVQGRYGGPNGFKHLIDACHRKGVSVILDVVYNHFGPDGNYLAAYAPDYFTDKHRTPWGAAINFDDVHAGTVRSFFIENALYWLEEYHLDGLRFDAVHAIEDDSQLDIVVELGNRIRETILDRPVHLILENDRNRASVLGGGIGGPGPHTAQWDDDFHHALWVLIANAEGGYYVDYEDRPVRHLARTLAEGFAYQGETSRLRDGRNRGENSIDLPPTAFVTFLQNHDQVGNHAYGWRMSKFATPEALRAGLAILLLSPHIPMLWQGEEWQADQPFPYFGDFTGELADAIREGRLREFGSFPEFRDPEARSRIPDPAAETTVASAALDWSALGRRNHRGWLEFYKRLIALRRAHIVPHLAGTPGRAGRFMTLDDATLDVRWRLNGADVQLVANLSAASRVVVPAIEGRVVYASGEQGREGLPPWYVSVSLAPR